MTLAVVQSIGTAAHGATSQPATNWTNTPTNGNLLVALGYVRNNSSPVGINGWTVFTSKATANWNLVCYYKYASSAPKIENVDNASNYQEWGLHFWELSGVAGVLWQDITGVTLGAQNGSGSSFAAGSLTTNTNTALVLSGFAGQFSSNAATLNWGSNTGWTHDSDFVSPSTASFSIFNWASGGHKTVSGGSAVTSTITASASAPAWTSGYVEIGVPPAQPAAPPPGSFVLASLYATVSGTTVTIQKQQNVWGVIRNATGQFTVYFGNTLQASNYGVIAGCRMPNNGANDAPGHCGPNANSSSGHTTYTTSSLDIRCSVFSTGTATDPSSISLVIFNPGVAAAGILASGQFSVSGGVCTVNSSQGVSGVTYKSTGLYEIDFSPSLVTANYCLISGGSFANGAGTNIAVVANNAQSPNNLHSASAYSMSATTITNFAAGVELSWGSFLVINPTLPPVGILAALRADWNASTITAQSNIASITHNASGGGARVNTLAYSVALSDANYGAICTTQSTTTGSTAAGLNAAAYFTGSSTSYSTTQLSMAEQSSALGDLIVFDPVLFAPSPPNINRSFPQWPSPQIPPRLRDYGLIYSTPPSMIIVVSMPQSFIDIPYSYQRLKRPFFIGQAPITLYAAPTSPGLRPSVVSFSNRLRRQEWRWSIPIVGPDDIMISIIW